MKSTKRAWSLGLGVASVTAASLLGISGAQAAPARPVPLDTAWPVCADADAWYCIELATMDGTDILSGPGSTVDSAPLLVNVRFLDENSIIWSVTWGSSVGELPASVDGARFRLVLRTGDLKPLFTRAIADEFSMVNAVAASESATSRVEIEGTYAVMHWRFADGFSCMPEDCGDDLTQATIAQRTFSGNTQNMATWEPTEREVFQGAYIATNAQASSVVPIHGTFPKPFWSLDLANPHLALSGAPATGSFTAFMPPNYFASLDTDAEGALRAGFIIERVEGGVTSFLSGTAREHEGGVSLRLPSVGYSAFTLRVSEADAVDADAGVADAAVVFVPDAGVAEDLGVVEDASIIVGDFSVPEPDAAAVDAGAAVDADVADAFVPGDASPLPVVDGGGLGDASSPPMTASEGGCSVADEGEGRGAWALIALGIAAVLRRRRR